VFEHLEVVFRTVSALLGARRVINGAHECYESIWYDPVKISVLNFLVVLVLLVVEVTELVPTVTDCDLKTFKTVEDSAFVCARVPITSVSKSSELFLVGRERLPNDFC
jgi:hypothetical protein